MMNMFELNERLKDFSKDQLMQEMQAPSGLAPQFMVLSELQRRTRMEQAMKADGQGAPQTTVAEDAVAAAGVPQGGLADMARALAPKTDMTENTGVAPVTAMQEGGRLRSRTSEIEDYLESLGPAERRLEEARLARDSMPMPSYPAVDLSTGYRMSIPPVAPPPVSEGGITFDDWRSMSRSEREAAGLPVSELGGQFGFNRFMTGLGADETVLMPKPLDYGPPRRRPPEEPPLPPDQATQDTARQFEEEAFADDFVRAQLPLPGQTSGRPENIFAPMTEAIETVLGPAQEPTPDAVARSFDAEAEADDAARVAGAEPRTPTAAPAGPGGAGGPGAGAPASNLDRMFEQDKWLSLARFGMALMSSQAPTFGQALGEAGTVGLDALSGARADYLARKQAADLMALRRAAASGGGRGGAGAGSDFGLSPDTARLLAERRDDLKLVDAQLAMAGHIPGTDVPPALVPLVRQREDILSDIQDIQNIGSGGALSALQAFRGQPGASGPVYDLTE